MTDTQAGPLAEPLLKDATVRLRRWAVTDLACVRAASEDTVIPEGTTVPRDCDDEAGRAWIARQWARSQTGQGWSLAVCDAHTGRAVGCVVLLLRPQKGVGGIGYWIVPEARGRGYASRAVNLMTGWGLRECGLARVEAWVEPDNDRSAGVLTRCGFEREGRLRSFLTFSSGRTDVLVFSRLAES
ncbi:GNAT family N-acetyltransferase [Nocardiopsis sp. CNR-923]|uniref:GNAT family N-acetyltransferase n=1 Tax=Nocardiopsis sp. CNR-923 TaxID=1904965 RepID=UPI000966A057|nr:GNAT family N-acetyltransferase [Nocardiopsis sp. CNR-923]OLT30330.1 GNAT family N-acetyltransferase [Nocardiopsis sp. CNR-923]